MSLTDFRTLGRSGLVVSPLALGTMTFGARRWGSDAETSRQVFNAYVAAGGNFIDTADIYSGGRSEETIGGLIAEPGMRDRLVIATKSGFGADSTNPHAGGNGAKNIHAALDGSLRRLRTDYVDLFWIHVWDMVTPAEELLETLAGLVRSGKIRYYALSNVPAWYAARIATLARAQGLPAPIALQFEYSLVERGIEGEYISMAAALGMGIVPWSPLGGGFLSGKYRRETHNSGGAVRTPELPDSAENAEKARSSDETRLSGSNPFGDTKFTERNWTILEKLRAIAERSGLTPAQAALAWLAQRPGVDSILIGASGPDQLAVNIASLDKSLSPEHIAALDTASEPGLGYPYTLFSPDVQRLIFGKDVRGRH